MNIYVMACLGTLFTFLMTVLGSAVVFIFRGELKESVQRVFFGFAAGVMMAASVWSLLLPAMDRALQLGMSSWIPAGGGFVLGGAFLWLMDVAVRKLKPEKMSHGSFLLFSAVTMHNVPEGMAVGLAFAAVGNGVNDFLPFASAIGLAVGIGIQNFPEGAAISLPLRKEGISKAKAFFCGSLTGIVEPMFGIPVVFMAEQIEPMMPWLLSFAAGAMIYVSVAELIPNAVDSRDKGTGIFGVMMGFLVMMLLDVALG